MKRLLKYLKEYRVECILGPLFKLLEASFELMVPLVVKRIIDVGIANGDRDYIVKMVLIMIALAVVGLTCSLTAQYFSAKAAVGFSAKVKNAVFSQKRRGCLQIDNSENIIQIFDGIILILGFGKSK